MIKSLKIVIFFDIIYALAITALFVFILKPYFSAINMNNMLIGGVNIFFAIILVISIIILYRWFVDPKNEVVGWIVLIILMFLFERLLLII
ncbi:hypothetical protein [Apilactobacillus apinorum]|uniref:hypothetical protein n=1 Tax=Apilactobacillus apinorum TaxID=1218495 RepID=UPI0033411C12